MRQGNPRSFAVALALALALAAAAAAPAGASGPKGPRYLLEITEGETTLPEYETIASTVGTVEGAPSQEVAVSIVRGGATVYRSIGEHGWASLSQVPQVGDVVTLEAPVGKTIGAVVYDGLPSIDPTVCAGSTNFSGSNSAGDVVEGFYVDRAPTFNPYGHFKEVVQTAFGEAQVKTLSGTTFGGSFLKPLAPGEDVIAKESLKTPLAGEATYTYVSETERPVGGCPVPPPVYSPPPAPALGGSIAKLLHTTIRALLKSGARDAVAINQPGTVVQDLYLKPGALPAFASSRKRHAPAPALLLARGSATATSAGTVTIVLHPTRRGRSRLHGAHSITGVLITTLRSNSGARIDLPRHTLTLHL